MLDDEPHVRVQTLPEGFIAVLRDLQHEREGDETGCGTFSGFEDGEPVCLARRVDAQRMITGRWHALHTLDQLRLQLSKGVPGWSIRMAFDM